MSEGLPIPSEPYDRLLELLSKDVIEAAIYLLGWKICFEGLEAEIVETEAYRTPDDPACHAHHGFTKRTEVLFGPPGIAYVYFTYGNHWMLNVSAHLDGVAAAVLIRAAYPTRGLELMRSRRIKAKKDQELLSGPGKICQAFGINGQHNGLPLLSSTVGLYLEPGSEVKSVLRGPRVGIAPGKGDQLEWRFIDRDRREWSSPPRLKVGEDLK